MASNMLCGLTGNLTELKSCDKNKKQTKDLKPDDIEPTYVNTTLTILECKRNSSEDNSYYERLNSPENTADTSEETDVAKRSAYQRNCRLVRALLGMVVVLIVAVAVIGALLAIEISKDKGTDGEWSIWSSWTNCSSTSCSKTRNRTCDNPAPSVYGHTCEGNSMDVDNCEVATCFGAVALKIRLANGTSRSGRLEVSIDGVNWGTVCDDDFDSSDARVACRMLGNVGSGVIPYGNTTAGSGPIFLDDLACLGSETSLLFCQHAGWGRHNCGHQEDVGVSC